MYSTHEVSDEPVAFKAPAAVIETVALEPPIAPIPLVTVNPSEALTVAPSRPIRLIVPVGPVTRVQLNAPVALDLSKAL